MRYMQYCDFEVWKIIAFTEHINADDTVQIFGGESLFDG